MGNNQPKAGSVAPDGEGPPEGFVAPVPGPPPEAANGDKPKSAQNGAAKSKTAGQTPTSGGTPDILWEHDCQMPKRYSQMKVTRAQQWAIPPSFSESYQLVNVGDVNHVMRMYEGTLQEQSSGEAASMMAYVISDIARKRYERTCFHLIWQLARKAYRPAGPPCLHYGSRADDLKALRSSPHIQAIYEVSQTDWRLFTAVERGVANLSQYIDMQGEIDELSAAKIFKQVTKAVDFLGKRRVMHRNICTASIFLMDDNPESYDGDEARVKLGDFAHAVMLAQGQEWHILPEQDRLSKRMPVGEPHIWSWSAANFGWGLSSDAWAVGICLHETLLGSFPIMIHKRLEGTRIRLRDFSGPQVEPGDMSPQAKQVLEGLLKKSTQERMKMDDVIRSAWLEDPERWFNEHQKTVDQLDPAAKAEKMKLRQSKIDATKRASQHMEAQASRTGGGLAEGMKAFASNLRASVVGRS
jgi:serine/threonine protein kinase